MPADVTQWIAAAGGLSLLAWVAYEKFGSHLRFPKLPASAPSEQKLDRLAALAEIESLRERALAHGCDAMVARANELAKTLYAEETPGEG